MKEDSSVNIFARECRYDALRSHPNERLENKRRQPEPILRAWRLGIHGYPRHSRNPVIVCVEDLALPGNQIIDTLCLRAADGRLDIRHFVLEANHIRPELLGLTAGAAMVAESKHLLEQVVVIGNEHAALASGDRLGAVKRESAK